MVHKSKNLLVNVLLAGTEKFASLKKKAKISAAMWKLRITDSEERINFLRRQWQKALLIVLWTILNIALFIEAAVRYHKILTNFDMVGEYRGGHKGIFTPFWVMMARGFGQLLNLNCALILPPVMRTILTLLQDLKLGIVLPFHKNIYFHRMIAYWIVVCGFLHGLAHYFNYACCPFQYFVVQTGDEPDDGPIPVTLPKHLLASDSGIEPTAITTMWFTYHPYDWGKTTKYGLTGNLLWIVMTLMYSASNKSYRQSSNFTVFWYVHHLFVAFFILLLIHGKFFWLWFLGPGTLYLLERILRNFRGIAPTIVKEVQLRSGGCLILKLDKPSMKYKAGQYAFVNCPLISRYEWHPFTISSSPKDPYLTFHVRVVGDWTRALRDLLNPTGKESVIINKPTGPDGKIALLRVDGPFGTEADFVFNFRTVMLVACGVGVTPFSSLLSEMRHRLRRKKGMKTERAYFYWMNRGRDGWEWFRDLLDECEREYPNFFDICTFMTGSAKREVIEQIIFSSSEYQANRNSTLKMKDMEFRSIKIIGRALHEYEATESGDIALNENDEIEIHDQGKDGWWTGTNKSTGKTGKFPGNYVELVDSQTNLQANTKRKFGRPSWEDEFDIVRQDVLKRYVKKKDQKVGLFFCGPYGLSTVLKKECLQNSKTTKSGQLVRFVFHKENF